MTREELREYVEELESQGEIPYYVYSNLIDCIDTLEQELTTKNDLGVDCISRAAARKAITDHQYSTNFCEEHNIDHSINTGMALIVLSDLPSVTPQEPILDKIREQIKDYLRGVEITLEVLVENHPLRPKMEGAKDTLEECLNLIDKAEAEADNG